MNTAVVMASTTRASGLLFRRATLHQLRQRGISRSTTTTTTTQRALQPNRPPGSTTTTKRWQQARAKTKNFSSDTHGSTTTAINTSTGDFVLTPIACVLLAVTLTYSSSESLPAEAGWWPFSNGGGWWRGGRKSSSPFDNTVPRRAKKQRAKAEVNMRAYLAKMRGPVQELVAGLREGKVTSLFLGLAWLGLAWLGVGSGLGRAWVGLELELGWGWVAVGLGLGWGATPRNWR